MDFFRKKDKVIIMVGRDDAVSATATEMVEALRSSLPLPSGAEVRIDLRRLEDVSLAAYHALVAFARECMQAGHSVRLLCDAGLAEHCASLGLELEWPAPTGAN